jgi:hypothetical protein
MHAQGKKRLPHTNDVQLMFSPKEKKEKKRKENISHPPNDRVVLFEVYRKRQ